MNFKNGLYLFPNGKKFSQFGYYDGNVYELAGSSYGVQLIDFIEFDFKSVLGLIEEARTKNHGELVELVRGFDVSNYVWLLARVMVEKNYSQMIFIDKNEVEPLYRDYVLNALRSVVDAAHEIIECADFYCDLDCPAEEKFGRFQNFYEDFLYVGVEEIISARKPGREFFDDYNIEDYCFPYSKAYRFDDIRVYSKFLFMNMMLHENNFSRCEYCDMFFIPKTKKPTRFCNRVDLRTGKSCMEFAPVFFNKLNLMENELEREYKNAQSRNLRRVSAVERRKNYMTTEKDIDYNTYSAWHERAREALVLWREKKISDEEFLRVVKELD